MGVTLGMYGLFGNEALAKLGGEIPLDLRQRLGASDAPWQIRTMIEESQMSTSLN